MKSRKFLVIGLFLVVIFLLAGCSNKKIEICEDGKAKITVSDNYTGYIVKDEDMLNINISQEYENYYTYTITPSKDGETTFTLMDMKEKLQNLEYTIKVKDGKIVEVK